VTGSRTMREGVLYALAAFGFCGFLPVYFKALREVPALEIVGHRVVWGVPMLALLVTLGRDWSGFLRAIRNPAILRALALSAVLVATNWLLFVYAVATDRVLQASLGYFINPLVNVLLGRLFLGETLRLPQALAVLLAAAGTLNLALAHSGTPWIALALAFSFGLYGLIRKTVRIEAVNGLFVETALLLPFSAGFLAFLCWSGRGAFVAGGWEVSLLLLLAGAVTVLPLIWFTAAARRLRYTTLGLFQYSTPTMHFVLAVALYREPFTAVHLTTFACIWIGLIVFVADSWIVQRRTRRATSHPG